MSPADLGRKHEFHGVQPVLPTEDVAATAPGRLLEVLVLRGHHAAPGLVVPLGVQGGRAVDPAVGEVQAVGELVQDQVLSVALVGRTVAHPIPREDHRPAVPGLSRVLKLLMWIGFPVALITTLYAARTFINSADYEPLAGKIWFFGYHATVAFFVALVATVLPRLMKRG